MREQLILLRKKMEEYKIAVYLIPTDDFHGSEYVGDYFKSREYVSGFTGSAGTLVVCMDKAGLWTDGRYFLQAKKQLAGSGITLYQSLQPGVPSILEFLKKECQLGETVAFDGRCMMAKDAQEYQKALASCDILLRSDVDLVGEIWTDRPSLSKETVWILEDVYAGASRTEKLEQVRAALKKKEADCFLLASLEDICWLLNVRGKDVACTPVVLSYLLLWQEKILWFVSRDSVPEAVKAVLAEDGITLVEYAQIYDAVGNLPEGSRLFYDESHVNMALIERIPAGVRKIEGENLTLRLKAVKNPVEIANERMAHCKDGVAVTKFLCWLKENIGKEEMTEQSVAARLEGFREDQPHYMGPSFTPIIAYGTHGAIVHYSATAEKNASLKKRGLVLADTGGHYLEGTTDITRTIVLGPLTREEKELYTTVLRGHIRLCRATFPKGCTGQSLDVLARMPLWERGLDYNHGTGHGVGYLLSVHEGPNNFRFRSPSNRSSDCIIEEGMITSDEPGIYLEGKFGIRLENLIVCVADRENEFGKFLKFEPLTMVPFDRDAILPELMTKEELEWLNGYHKKVFDTISPFLTPKEVRWLERETGEICQGIC